MENENNESVVEEVTQEPKMDDKVEGLKVKKKKFSNDLDAVAKVDLSKPVEENEKPEETTTSEVDNPGVVGGNESSEPVQEQEEVQQEVQAQETPVLEEVTEEEEATVEPDASVDVVKERVMPEAVDKLVKFMEDTGGTLEDYVRLNQDYNEMDNLTALEEYYKQTKPHLDAEERKFLMDESFSFDEEVDDEKDIRKKKIALKEQVAEAKAYLDGQKSKYYEELKAGSRLTPEAQKAIEFFNRYNKESESNQKKFKQAKDVFNKKTDDLFSQDFKGFDFNVGEKKFRFKVKDANSVKESQSDINNFVKRFLNEDGTMEDAGGYHKGLYTAMNADAVAKHFYEQGKADALKESVENSKNINMGARQTQKEIEVGGTKYKVLSGDSKSGLKFKIKK